jgi:hypothetical protein
MSMITFSQLGGRGRYGNSLLQRSWIKAYATEHNSEWGVAPWVGSHLFGLQDPPVTETLPPFPEKCEAGDVHKPLPPEGDEAIIKAGCNSERPGGRPNAARSGETTSRRKPGWSG